MYSMHSASVAAQLRSSEYSELHTQSLYSHCARDCTDCASQVCRLCTVLELCVKALYSRLLRGDSSWFEFWASCRGRRTTKRRSTWCVGVRAPRLLLWLPYSLDPLPVPAARGGCALFPC
jgi:hypothetical protein